MLAYRFFTPYLLSLFCLLNIASTGSFGAETTKKNEITLYYGLGGYYVEPNVGLDGLKIRQNPNTDNLNTKQLTISGKKLKRTDILRKGLQLYLNDKNKDKGDIYKYLGLSEFYDGLNMTFFIIVVFAQDKNGNINILNEELFNVDQYTRIGLGMVSHRCVSDIEQSKSLPCIVACHFDKKPHKTLEEFEKKYNTELNNPNQDLMPIKKQNIQLGSKNQYLMSFKMKASIFLVILAAATGTILKIIYDIQKDQRVTTEKEVIV